MRGRQLIDEYIREGRLSANRSQPIGAGSYGTVYQSDEPGYVIKQNHPQRFTDDLETETNLQAIAAELGIAPAVRSYERFPEGTQRIEMADARTNYVPTDGSAATEMRTAQQLGELALKGVRLEDRRGANVMQHSMTGRPLQLDFGIAGRVSGEDQALVLAEATADGMKAAGLGDLGDILYATVGDMVAGGDVAEAMDLAKQGFSRLQKIKAPLEEAISIY
jgi:hypothetical protein